MQVRPITPDDEPALAALEARLLARHQTPRTGPAALRFFARTGHSFVAEEGGRARGFVLAQPLWQGDRATVFVTRLLADDPPPPTRSPAPPGTGTRPSSPSSTSCRGRASSYGRWAAAAPAGPTGVF